MRLCERSEQASLRAASRILRQCRDGNRPARPGLARVGSDAAMAPLGKSLIAIWRSDRGARLGAVGRAGSPCALIALAGCPGIFTFAW